MKYKSYSALDQIFERWKLRFYFSSHQKRTLKGSVVKINALILKLCNFK